MPPHFASSPQWLNKTAPSTPPLCIGRHGWRKLAPSALPIRIEASSVHSSPPLSSPATSTPSLEQQKSGEIREEKTAAGEVPGDAHASGDLLGVPHVAGVVSGRPQPHTSSEVHAEMLGGGDFQRKKIRNKANKSAPIGVYGEQSRAGDFLLSLKAISQASIRHTDRQNTHRTNVSLVLT